MLETTIPVVETNTQHTVHRRRNRSAEYTIEIEGPLSRIATAEPL